MALAFVGARATAVRQRHAAHPGDQPRCRHRARLLEEHVRARRRAEPHRARQGRGGAPHPGSAGRALRRGRLRRRADELPAHERRRGDRAVLPPARAERHAGRRHGDRARARARRASSSRAIPKSKDHVRVIVLVTDGEDLEGDPVERGDAAASRRGRASTSCRSAGARRSRSPTSAPDGKIDGHPPATSEGKPLTTRALGRGRGAARARSRRSTGRHDRARRARRRRASTRSRAASRR